MAVTDVSPGGRGFYKLSQLFTTLYNLVPGHRASHLTDRWHPVHLQSLVGRAHGILKEVAPEASLNWSWLTLRVAIAATMLLLLFLSQRFWYRSLWRWSAKWGSRVLRVAARLVYLAGLLLIIVSLADSIRNGHGRLLPRGTFLNVLAGLWFFSALFAYLSVKVVHVIDGAWQFLRPSPRFNDPETANLDLPVDPGRRYFFKTATAAAGAAPFIGAMYGFAAERLNYQVHCVEIPVSNLPAALNGLKITQLSDIHLSGYMPRAQVRRAIEMANELGGDLAVVTGDFITGADDPLEDCVDEIRRLASPLGVYGCNGNHEIYADAEDHAQWLFAQAGLKLLRQECTVVNYRGAQLNLIGVDYQRERTPGGRRVSLLSGAQHLVRKDMPNILLSHNPNSFNRAAELGVELSLAGHTHGGQVQVEILDHRLSPARFITDYVAGLYMRPLFTPARTVASQKFLHATTLQGPHAAIYVNRGLGTVGAPVRLGVPPEISLLVLRSA
jgi:predicted MPP superfamily phosphohydrolase